MLRVTCEVVSSLLFRKRPTPKSEYDMEDIKKKLKDTNFEKGDTLALIIAALITIVPAMLIIIASILGIVWLFFFR